jgi:hypothetical protein
VQVRRRYLDAWGVVHTYSIVVDVTVHQAKKSNTGTSSLENQCNDPPASPRPGPPTPDKLSRTLRISPTDQHMSFLRTLCSLMRHPGRTSRSVTHIAPCQARLTLEFLVMGFRKRSCNLFLRVPLPILSSLWAGASQPGSIENRDQMEELYPNAPFN